MNTEMGFHDETNPSRKDPTAVEATGKSIEIIRSIKEDGPATLTEIATRLGYSKSTVHRHVTTLENEGYIAEGDAGYQIGLLYLDFGIHARNENQLFQIAKQKADDLADSVDENVWLMIEENDYGVFIYHATDEYPVRTFTREGYRGHLHAFAGGKAVLAFLDPARVEEIIERRGLPAQNAQTITDRGELSSELEQIREQGVAFNRNESVWGINAVAAPILDRTGDPLGSVSVAGPANRLKGEYLEEDLPELLLGVTNEIEVNMTYQ